MRNAEFVCSGCQGGNHPACTGHLYDPHDCDCQHKPR